MPARGTRRSGCPSRRVIVPNARRFGLAVPASEGNREPNGDRDRPSGPFPVVSGLPSRSGGAGCREPPFDRTGFPESRRPSSCPISGKCFGRCLPAKRSARFSGRPRGSERRWIFRPRAMRREGSVRPVATRRPEAGRVRDRARSEIPPAGESRARRHRGVRHHPEGDVHLPTFYVPVSEYQRVAASRPPKCRSRAKPAQPCESEAGCRMARHIGSAGTLPRCRHT